MNGRPWVSQGHWGQGSEGCSLPWCEWGAVCDILLKSSAHRWLVYYSPVHSLASYYLLLHQYMSWSYSVICKFQVSKEVQHKRMWKSPGWELKYFIQQSVHYSSPRHEWSLCETIECESQKNYLIYKPLFKCHLLFFWCRCRHVWELKYFRQESVRYASPQHKWWWVWDSRMWKSRKSAYLPITFPTLTLLSATFSCQ